MLLRKLFRTAWKYKAQFLSMIIMVTIGMGIFFGFNMEWYSLQIDIMSFLEDTDYADYRLYGEDGFSEDDIAAVRAIDGVEKAIRVLSVTVSVKNTEKSLSLFCPESDEVSSTVRIEGEEYNAEKDGFWLSDKFAAANNISVGDELTVKYGAEITCKVLGLVKSGEYLVCVSGGDQVMPDYSTYGFVYAPPETIFRAAFGDTGFTYYSQINLISDLSQTELKEKVNEALGKTTLILSKDDAYSYAAALSEVEEGQTMGSILPVLFLFIGILTMVTTMHRITANEKTQIGTLKALGFKNKRILLHYTLYGLFIGLFGCIVGIALGYGIAAVIVNPVTMEGTYFDMPVWDLYAPWVCWIVLAVTVLLLTFICFLSVKKMLKGTAADALRPYTPKRMKPLLIERTKLFDRASFSVRWNLRDTMRHKARSLMTLVGVVGCTILIVGAMGMNDTMQAFIGEIDHTYNYETRVSFSAAVDDGEILSFAQSVNGDLLAEKSVQYNGGAVSLEIYNLEHGKIVFLNDKYEEIKIGDGGVYLCDRLSENVRIGDTVTFSPYGSEKSYSVRVAGFVLSFVTENIVMTENYAKSVGVEYNYTAVFTDVPALQIEAMSENYTTSAKEALLQSYDSFMEILYIMVVMLILAAVILGAVVLYSLGVMSYMERYRELATLKVVGFKDKHIGRILIEQNIWLTVLGIALGVPAGIGVLYGLVKALATEYELVVVLGAPTFLVGILLTFAISFFVGLFVARKNKKIDMVESLKGAE